MPPKTTTVHLTGDVMPRANGFGLSPEGARIIGYTQPGAWPMQSMSSVFNADGTPYTSRRAQSRMTGNPDGDFACIGRQNLHFSYRYQPDSRYWPFQWIELSGYTVLSPLLAAAGYWWIRRRMTRGRLSAGSVGGPNVGTFGALHTTLRAGASSVTGGASAPTGTQTKLRVISRKPLRPGSRSSSATQSLAEPQFLRVPAGRQGLPFDGTKPLASPIIPDRDVTSHDEPCDNSACGQ